MATRVNITLNGQNVMEFQAVYAISELLGEMVEMVRVGGNSSTVWIVQSDEITPEINDTPQGDGYEIRFLGRA